MIVQNLYCQEIYSTLSHRLQWLDLFRFHCYKICELWYKNFQKLFFVIEILTVAIPQFRQEYQYFEKICYLKDKNFLNPRFFPFYYFYSDFYDDDYFIRQFTRRSLNMVQFLSNADYYES